MPTARKLPSGSWRVQVYYKDKNGNIHRPSFTATTKREAEMMADKFILDTDRRLADSITVGQAVENYIESNKAVLSPSTVYNYTKDMKRLEPIKNINIQKLTSKDIQDFISHLVNAELSPKTIKNTYGLLRTSLTFSGIDKQFVIHLPSNPKKKKIAPENEQIIALYQAANKKMKIAISLAAFHSLRRGEVCGLKYGDLNGNALYIHSDMVKSADGKSWVHKETPKTDASNRTVYLSQKEVELIGTGNPDDYIVNLTPGSVGTNFYNLCKRTGIKLRFHDLRGYYASISVAIGIPDIYLAHMGGWRENSSVLKEHYQKPISSIDEGYAQKLNQYFDNLTS